jgi:hypothetical protein
MLGLYLNWQLNSGYVLCSAKDRLVFDAQQRRVP